MNILFLTYSTQFGGDDTFLINLISHWPQKDNTLIVSTNRRLGFNRYQSLENDKNVVVCEEFKILRWLTIRANTNKHKGFIKFLAIVWNGLFLMLLGILCFFEFRRIVRKHNVDVFVSNSGGFPGGDLTVLSLFYAKCLGLKKIYYIIHNFPAMQGRKSFLGRLSKYLNKVCICVFTVSNAAANSLKEVTYFDNIQVIYNGIAYSQRQVSKNIQTKHKKNIGVIANLEHRKGHIYLLQAFKKVLEQNKDVGLYFIGSKNNAYKQIVDFIKYNNLEDNVFIMGFKENASSYIYNFDFLVLPSISFESFGLAILEGWGFKKPTVAFKTGGVLEVITDKYDGILVNSKDVEVLFESCQDLLNNPSKIRSMGKFGFEKVNSTFNAKRMASEYCNMIVN